MQETEETQVWSLGPEDPRRRARQPTPVFTAGEFHGQRILAGYSPWVTKSRSWLKWLSTLHGKKLQYFHLENSMDRGSWWATVHGSRRVRHDWSDWACVRGKKLISQVKARLYQHLLDPSSAPWALPVSHPLPRASTKWTLQNGNESFDFRPNSFQITAPTYLLRVLGQIAWSLSASTSPSVKWL